jgi:hypothetical protein
VSEALFTVKIGCADASGANQTSEKNSHSVRRKDIEYGRMRLRCSRSVSSATAVPGL